MKNNLQFYKLYKIVDLQPNYVSLIICVYQSSEFYVLFNQRKYITNETDQINQKTHSKILKQIIQNAEKDLKIKIKEVSFNLPIKDIQISKGSYIHQFEKNIEITPEVIKTITNLFMQQSDYSNEFKNILSKITTYHLIDTNVLTKTPPIGSFTSSIKLEGYTYKISWKILYQYLPIFQKARVKINPLILLPYSIYVSLLFSQKLKELIIVLWNKNKFQCFYFKNQILLKIFDLNENLNYFIENLTTKYNLSQIDIENYLFKYLDINPKRDKLFQGFLELHNKKLSDQKTQMRIWTEKYITYMAETITKLFTTKVNLESKNISFFVTGEILNITNIDKFFKSKLKFSNWKFEENLFIGLIDFRDTFSIGNAYYQYLENKVLYNQSSKSKANI